MERKINNAKNPPVQSRSRGFRASMKLDINIDTNIGFQFNCDAVPPDGYLFDPASHQRFVKFGEVGSLLCDIILQVIDPLYLFIPCGSVDGGFLAELSKPDSYFCLQASG